MPLSQKAQAIIDAFGRQHDAVHLGHLRQAIDASPVLIEQINQVVAQHRLRSIVASHTVNLGGNYDARARVLHLPLAILDATPGDQFDSAEAIFALGHELQHGLNAAYALEAWERFKQEATAVTVSINPQHDYTRSFRHFLASARVDEASAEIAAWNAMASAARKQAKDLHRPPPTLEDLYQWHPPRMADFIDVDRSDRWPTCSLKPNLELDADQRLPASTRNLEGMGQNFFDAPARLGPKRNSSYTNYFGAVLISHAVQYERRQQWAHPHTPCAELRVDLASLGLDPSVIADNGINLGRGMASTPYVDASTDPPVRGYFAHTAAGPEQAAPRPLSPRRR